MSAYLGLIELLFFAALCLGFYVWQMRDLRREKEKRLRRDAEEAARGSDAARHPERKHPLDEGGGEADP